MNQEKPFLDDADYYYFESYKDLFECVRRHPVNERADSVLFCFIISSFAKFLKSQSPEEQRKLYSGILCALAKLYRNDAVGFLLIPIRSNAVNLNIDELYVYRSLAKLSEDLICYTTLSEEALCDFNEPAAAMLAVLKARALVKIDKPYRTLNVERYKEEEKRKRKLRNKLSRFFGMIPSIMPAR